MKTTTNCFVALIMLLFPLYNQAQELEYFNKQGETVFDSIKAVSYRRIKPTEQATFKGKSQEFYKNTTILYAECEYDKGLREGKSQYFYPDGKVYGQGKFMRNNKLGHWKYFYPQGGVQRMVFFHLVIDTLSGKVQRNDSTIVGVWDWDAKQVVNSGDGKYVGYYPSGKVFETGKYLLNKKDSIWTGYYENGKPYFEEVYRKGSLQKGVSFGENGEKYTYSEIEGVCEPIMGYNAYQALLEKNLFYPMEALRNGIEGKVILGCIINEQGLPEDLVVLKGLEGGCNDTALTLIRNAPKWKPATKRGKPAPQKVSITINFKISK